MLKCQSQIWLEPNSQHTLKVLNFQFLPPPQFRINKITCSIVILSTPTKNTLAILRRYWGFKIVGGGEGEGQRVFTSLFLIPVIFPWFYLSALFLAFMYYCKILYCKRFFRLFLLLPTIS